MSYQIVIDDIKNKKSGYELRLSEDAILYRSVKEGLTDKVTFETRFTKEREKILKLYNKIFLGRGNSKYKGWRIKGFDMPKEQQEIQARFETEEEEC